MTTTTSIPLATEQPATIALKVDVDTFCGTRDGIPNLLRIFRDFGIKATFYFSLGPDNSGKALRRLLHPGFLAKMLRTSAPSVYGWRTMLSGTLLPAPMIAAKLPDVIATVKEAGHEVGVHCWDHVEWHDHLSRFSRDAVAAELGRAAVAFEKIFGFPPRTTAAPGWTVTPNSLDVQDAMDLSYCSDSRGSFPFFPAMGGKRFGTLQVPSTWPTMDELLGENGITRETVNERYLQLLRQGLNVHTIHAELEGKAMEDTFVDLLQRLSGRNVRFVTLGEAAAEFGQDAPVCEVEMGYIPGRAMPVALQKA